MGYIRKSPKKAVVDGEDKHPYMKGYSEWVKLQFWEGRDDITEKGKEYFRASLNRMSKAHNLTKIDQSLQ